MPISTALTPLMQQYQELKSRHAEEILLFRLGDFYEMFDEDAEIVARELEIAKELAPDSALVRSHLAMVYSRLGRTEAAKAEAAAFLRLKNKEGVLAPPQEKLKSSVQEKTQ